MNQIWTLLRPSIPPVGLLLEPPFAAALRVDRLGRSGNPTASHVGSLIRDRDLKADPMKEVAEAALLRLGSPRRLNLVLGDVYFRSQVLEVSAFPRKEAERSQVLKWHIRKNLDFPVDAARIRYQVLRKTSSSFSIWITVAREDEIRGMEDAFRSRGCEVGHVGVSTLELYNLALQRDMLASNGATLVLNRAGNEITFLFLEEGIPLFYRSKELPSEAWPDERGERIAHELRLTLAFFRERFGGSPLRRVLVRNVPEESPLPLEEVLSEEEVLVMDRVIQGGQPGAHRQPLTLPLFGVLEGS